MSEERDIVDRLWSVEGEDFCDSQLRVGEVVAIPRRWVAEAAEQITELRSDLKLAQELAAEIDRLRSIERRAADIEDAIEWGGGASDWVHRDDPDMTLKMSLIAAEGEREAAEAAAKGGE